MHSQDTIEQCLKLRAESRSYRRIAEQLNVSVPTVEKWIKAHHAQLNQMRADRLEALHERYLGNYEDKLSDMANEVAAINAELKLRELSCVSTEFLLYRKTCLQARMEKAAANETQTVASQPETAISEPQPEPPSEN
jgi:hypothetical protein